MKWLALLVIAGTALPCAAKTYLSFPDGEDRSNSIYQTRGDKAPTVAGETIVEWVPVNGDSDNHNYRLVGGQIVYSKDISPEPIGQAPDQDKFLKLCSTDPEIEAEAQPYINALHDLQVEDQQEAWQKFSAKLSPETMAAIEAHAEECHMPLK